MHAYFLSALKSLCTVIQLLQSQAITKGTEGAALCFKYYAAQQDQVSDCTPERLPRRIIACMLAVILVWIV